MSVKTIHREITLAQNELLDLFPHFEAEQFQNRMVEIITAGALVNRDPLTQNTRDGLQLCSIMYRIFLQMREERKAGYED